MSIGIRSAGELLVSTDLFKYSQDCFSQHGKFVTDDAPDDSVRQAVILVTQDISDIANAATEFPGVTV